MALDYVLHVRYMTPAVGRGTSNYGGQDFGDPDCNTLTTDKQEAPFTSNTADVARVTADWGQYFNSDTSRYLGGAPVGLGGMDGTIESSNFHKQAVNRAICFMKKDYVIIGDKVYVYNDDTELWSTSLALTGKDGTRTNSIGLYAFTFGGRPKLCTAWNTTSNNWRFAIFDGLTETWTTSSEFAGIANPNDANGGVLNECQHKGKIYFTTSSETNIYYFDFIGESFGVISFLSTARHPMDMVSFEGFLYVLYKDNSGNVRLGRLNEQLKQIENQSTFPRSATGEHAADVNEALTTTSQFEGRPLLFVDNIYDDDPSSNPKPVLWAYYVCHAFSDAGVGLDGTASNYGLQAYPFIHDSNNNIVRLDAAQGSASIGFRANPFKMMHNQEGASGQPSRKDEDIVLRCYVDQKNRDLDLSNKSALVVASRYSGQNPFCTEDGGGGDFGNLMYHEFMGSGNADGGSHPNPPTAGGGAHAFKFLGFPAKAVRHRAFPHERIGGGARHSVVDPSGNKLSDIIYRGMQPVAGNMRIYYNLLDSAGAPSGFPVSVRWFYDDNRHAPEKQCTIIAASEGSIDGNVVDSISLDPNVLYYVDWDAQGDGVARGARVTINGQVNLTDVDVSAVNNPTELHGLIAWFDANDASTLSIDGADDVIEWRDKSGAGIISAVGQSGVSSRPHRFIGTNDYIDFDRSNSEYLISSGWLESSTPLTIYAVYRCNSQPSRHTILSIANNEELNGEYSHDYIDIYGDSNGDLFVESQDADRTITSTPPRALSISDGAQIGETKLVFSKEFAFEGRISLFPDSTSSITDFTTDGTSEPSGLSNFTVGRFSGAQVSGVYNDEGNYLNGRVYEIAIYNRILNDVEQERLKTYAENRYTLS